MRQRSLQGWCAQLEEVAAEAARSDAYAAFHQAEIAAFEACENASELWALAQCDLLTEATYAEDAYPPGVVDALMHHAATWEAAEDRALAWALAARIVAFDPGKVVMVDEDAIGTKPEPQAAFDRHIALHRRGVQDGDPRVRASALHALGCCDTPPWPKTARRMAHSRLGCSSRPTRKSSSTTPNSAMCRVCSTSLMSPIPEGPIIAPARR